MQTTMKMMMYGIMGLIFMNTTACKKFIDGYDKSPDNPGTATPALLLANAEVAYFATASGQLSRQTSMFIQQNTGINGRSLELNNYMIDDATNVYEWTVIYGNGLLSVNTLYEQAGAGNPYYQGIARVLMAMYLGMATDLWGDIPNREAFGGMQGAASFNPHYDAQWLVIADMQAYLSEGIALLSKAPAPTTNLMKPGADDLIYSGNVARWIAAAHVLKARYYNRLSKRDLVGSATHALAELAAARAAGFTSNTGDAEAHFGNNSNEYNPYYAFTVQEQAGQVKAGLALTDMMNAWADPRMRFYFRPDTGGGFNGSAPDVPDVNASEIGPYLATANASFPLITYAESKFIEAEAALRLENKEAAAAAFNEAVKASVLRVTGVQDTAFENASAAETYASITWEKVMLHKYVALYGQVEAYADWRRTAIPMLTPNTHGAVGAIPKRLPTVISEKQYNRNADHITDITKAVWWEE